MRSLLVKKILVALPLLTVLACAKAQQPAQTIPGFRFVKLDNTGFTDKDIDGNKLSFFCFFDITCDHCHHAIEKINKRIREFRKTNVFLVTLDDKQGIINFLKHYGPNLQGNKAVTILQDQQHQFITKFRPVKYPSMFLYTRSRKLVLYSDNEADVDKFLVQVKALAK